MKLKFIYLAVLGLLATSANIIADAGPPITVPDGGSSAVLLGIGAVGLALARTIVRKK